MNKFLIIFVLTALLAALGCAPTPNDEPAEENDHDNAETIKFNLYFGYPEAIESGEPGRYGYVTPVSREKPHTEQVLRTALEELIKGPAPGDGDVSPVVHSSLKILDINIEDKVATINVGEEMFGKDWTGGSLGGTIFIQAFTRTAAQFPTVDKVQVLVEGEYWDDGHRVWDEPLAPQEEKEETPQEVTEWIDRSRDLWLGQDVEIDDTLYLLVTYGVQPTGGYSVEIKNLTEQEDKLLVTVEFTEPAEGEPVTQALTRPYDLKTSEPTDLPVEFVAEGDEMYVPTLWGIDKLPPIAAQSDGIKVFSPAPGSTVASEFDVTGIANVFEGTVLYRLLLGSTGEELYSGITTGAMGDWGYFEEEIAVPGETNSGEQLILELYTESAKDGSIQDLIEIEIELELELQS